MLYGYLLLYFSADRTKVGSINDLIPCSRVSSGTGQYLRIDSDARELLKSEANGQNIGLKTFYSPGFKTKMIIN